MKKFSIPHSQVPKLLLSNISIDSSVYSINKIINLVVKSMNSKNSLSSKGKETSRCPKKIAYVFQGGGALGAYQVGVIQALQEYGYSPDMVSGISIGAINAAILVGNSKEERLKKLHLFWDKIATPLPLDPFSNPRYGEGLYSYIGAIAATFWGQSGFFTPRLMPPWLLRDKKPDELSFYDLNPLRETLEELIDFDRINAKEESLYLGTVCLHTGHLTYFNNIDYKIGPEHIMASAALPPAFPAVKIGDRYFWDGALYSNSPLSAILDDERVCNLLCFAVNCFSAKGFLPTSIDEVNQREKGIRYSSHMKEALTDFSKEQNLRCAITHLGSKLSEEAKKDPAIQEILALGTPRLINIVKMVYQDTAYDLNSKDYNFAKHTLDEHLKAGYQDAMAVLEEKAWEQKQEKYIGAVVYQAPNNPK